MPIADAMPRTRTLTTADLRCAAAGTSARPTALPLDVLTIGVFDALHLGHRRIIERLNEVRNSGEIGVLTFHPHPRAVLLGQAPVRVLTEETRDALLRAWGVDWVITLEVDRELLAMDPAEFLKGLSGCIAFRKILVGPNFHFGRGRSGTVQTLRELVGAAQVEIVDGVEVAGEMASATRVRVLLSEGDLAGAAAVMGRPYAVWGRLVPGDGLGARIGSPTLNLEPVPPALPDGVYAVDTSEGAGVVHLGPRPTLHREERRFELHLLDRQPEAVERVEVRFQERLRDVKAFSDTAALRVQIAEDIVAARKTLGVAR